MNEHPFLDCLPICERCSRILYRDTPITIIHYQASDVHAATTTTESLTASLTQPTLPCRLPNATPFNTVEGG